MKMYLLECPACNAKLEIELDRAFCFCSYCGSKVYLEDDTKRVEITKTINYHKTYTNEAKIKDIEFRERMFDKQLAAEKESAKRNRRIAIRRFLLGAICVIVIVGAMTWGATSAKKESDTQEIEFQQVVDEIMKDIENGDFNSARVKAESLHYTADWSSEVEEKWDSTREELLEQIDEAEKAAKKEAKKAEKEANKASRGTWWNPFD